MIPNDHHKRTSKHIKYLNKTKYEHTIDGKDSDIDIYDDNKRDKENDADDYADTKHEIKDIGNKN